MGCWLGSAPLGLGGGGSGLSTARALQRRFPGETQEHLPSQDGLLPAVPHDACGDLSGSHVPRKAPTQWSNASLQLCGGSRTRTKTYTECFLSGASDRPPGVSLPPCHPSSWSSCEVTRCWQWAPPQRPSPNPTLLSQFQEPPPPRPPGKARCWQEGFPERSWGREEQVSKGGAETSGVWGRGRNVGRGLGVGYGGG